MTADTRDVCQGPKCETRLEVCCAMPQGTTVTQAEMRAATEAVKAIGSIVMHGKVMLNLDGQVLENSSNPFKRIRSLVTGQRDCRLQEEAVSLDVRASSAKHFELASVLFSDETSHFEGSDSSNLKADTQMTPAKRPEARASGAAGLASVSSILSRDGTTRVERK